MREVAIPYPEVAYRYEQLRRFGAMMKMMTLSSATQTNLAPDANGRSESVGFREEIVEADVAVEFKKRSSRADAPGLISLLARRSPQDLRSRPFNSRR